MMIRPFATASAVALSVVLAQAAAGQTFAPLPNEGTAAPEIGVLPLQADQEPAPAEEPAAPTEAAEPAEGEEAPEAEAEAEAPAAVAEPGAEAAPGEAGAEPQVLEIVRDTFQDWEVRCAAQGDDCFVYQVAYDENENPIAEFSVVRLTGAGEAVAGATVVTPLGTFLPGGLVMQIGGGEARQYPFTFCSQVGCFAQLALNQATLSSLQRGRTARLALASVAAPNEPIELELSLLGFTAAFNSLQNPQ